MSTIPSIENILLQIYQSLGGEAYPTVKKQKFTAGKMQLSSHFKMADEILNSIFGALNLDDQSCNDIGENIFEMAKFNKAVELNTWTFNADQRQIIWMALSHIYIPGIARHAANWNLEEVLDKGMPSGKFWYLPEVYEIDGKKSLCLPVAQVMDWLLDILGKSTEEFAEERSQSLKDLEEKETEKLIRLIYKWRRETVPSLNKINTYFPDDMEVAFNGALSLDNNLSIDEQFNEVLSFINHKKLTADKLSKEISITQLDRLQDILIGKVSDDIKQTFVQCMLVRYEKPTPKLIRQRLLFARMVQDGYIRLLKYLLPNISPSCTDPQKNKMLQLVAIYKLIYNLTIDAWRKYKSQGENAENTWFEKQLPPIDKQQLYLSILPSKKLTAYKELSNLLTRYFADIEPKAKFEDHIGLDELSAKSIFLRNTTRLKNELEEIDAAEHLINRIKTSSPWRTLQNEGRYWVVSQVAQSIELSSKAQEIAIKRLHEISSNSAQKVGAILLDLDRILNTQEKRISKDNYYVVKSLIEQAETSDVNNIWEAPILQYKAKHYLYSNDFSKAEELFREALKACIQRNYGSLKGEIARDCLAVVVANQKLIKNNHEIYYREMLAGGIMEGSAELPSIEDSAKWASEYFWDTLYKPYLSNDAVKPISAEIVKDMFKNLMPLFDTADFEAISDWVNSNKKILKSNLPYIQGDTVLMLLIKMYVSFKKTNAYIQKAPSSEMQKDSIRFEKMLSNMCEGIAIIANKAPKQLNIADFKSQTPLMLVAEMGDTKLIKSLIKSGADPEKQDYQGMTALHSAIKSGIKDCIDVLLDHPCKTDNVTIDNRTVLHTAAWTANFHAIERLLVLDPELSRKRDLNNLTALEYVERLIEEPKAYEAIKKELSTSNVCCPSKKEFRKVIELLELAPIAK